MTSMKKWIVGLCVVLFGAILYFHQTIAQTMIEFSHSFVVYASVPEQIPLKLHTLDDQGKPILDSYTYTYHLTGITKQHEMKQLTYECSGETAIPLEPNTYVRMFMLFGHPIGAPKKIKLTRIPTSILEQLELEQLTHKQHLRWTASNP